MLGTSRESLAALQQFAFARQAGAGVPEELLNAAAMLSGDRAFRVAVTDAGLAAESRAGIVRDVLGSRVSDSALAVLVQAVELRWAEDTDLVEALEAVAAGIIFAAAEVAGELDRMEEEVFRFDRAVEANAELQMALTNPALSAELKAGIVRDVLGGRALAGTEVLLAHAAGNLRGRRVDVALGLLSQAAAAHRERSVAQVRVAIAITEEQKARLAAVLARLAGRAVSLNVVVDPTIVGGVSVRLGDEVIDGTVRTRLDQARRALVG